MKLPPSESEDRGVAARPKDALNIYSIGISTMGIAETRMALPDERVHIVATTIDENGLEETRRYLDSQGLGDRIELKNEDVAELLPYDDGAFDYVYARLVFHYLSKQQLESALSECYRILKPGGRIFIVVRSTKCIDPDREYSYNEHTMMHEYISQKGTDHEEHRKRFFHTRESIAKFVESSNFNILSIDDYYERVFHDYERTIDPGHDTHVIEVIAEKP